MWPFYETIFGGQTNKKEKGKEKIPNFYFTAELI
jgi:hypothetical protein